MNIDNTEKRRRFALRQSDKIILGIIGVMVVAIIALTILQQAGLWLINGALMLYLPVMALIALVGWGGYALVRRIRKNGLRYVAIAALATLIMVVLVLAFTYVGFIATITVPQRYTTVRSPSGKHTLVVMRALDPDEGRISQRHDARMEVAPDSDPGVTVTDWGYVYRAYPQALLGLFYRQNADVEGEVYLAYGDGAIPFTEEEAAAAAARMQRGTLMMDWDDDEQTAHFYAENPGPGEGGDCYVRFGG